MPSKIEWTDETWNPIVGCSKVSQGCQNCYAERMAARFAWSSAPDFTGGCDSLGDPGGPFETVIENGKWNGQTELKERRLDQPLRWKKPRKIFVCSMGDLFHESVPDEWLDKVFQTMWFCNRHRFMLLTKRPQRMMDYILGYKPGPKTWPLPNVWLGVTAENREQWIKRVDVLRQIPATVRFVSNEPSIVHIGQVDLTGIHWVISGAETGPGKRLMDPAWPLFLRDQCADVGIPFFFKKDSDGNRLLNGREWNEYPEARQA